MIRSYRFVSVLGKIPQVSRMSNAKDRLPILSRRSILWTLYGRAWLSDWVWSCDWDGLWIACDHGHRILPLPEVIKVCSMGEGAYGGGRRGGWASVDGLPS